MKKKRHYQNQIKGTITTKSTNIKRIRPYFGQFYANTFDNLDALEKFPQKIQMTKPPEDRNFGYISTIYIKSITPSSPPPPPKLRV